MTTDINFQYYPSTNRLPGFYAEINGSQANTEQQNWVGLIIGQMITGSPGTAGAAVISSGVGDAETQFGAGSMLHCMVNRYRQEDDEGELWLLPLADATGAVAATGSIAITAVPTSTGTLSLYIGGLRVQLAVSSTLTTGQIATALAAAINATNLMMVNATVAAGSSTISLTALNKGAAAGDIPVMWNYLGIPGGEVTPPGFGGTITPMSGGSANPDLAAALAGLGDQQFDFIILPYTDTNSLSEIAAFLGDASGGRWAWDKMLYGVAITCARGTYGALTALGPAQNFDHTCIMGMYGGPEPVWLWAADLGANVAVSVRADPAQPLQDIQLGVLAPQPVNLFPRDERETLLYDGISTFKVNRGGQVLTERLISTYETNAAGDADTSWLDIETDFTLMAVIRDLRAYCQTQFFRMKLVADGTTIPVGSNLVTSQTILGSVNARYRTLETLGLVQNSAEFVQQSAAQNAGNGVVKLLLPIQIANQLRIIAALIQFSKP